MSGARLAPAGKDLDAVRVTRFVGLQVTELLGSAVGPVIMDPSARSMYFLVSPGTTGAWSDLPQCTTLGETDHVVMPPQGKQTPPGLDWLIPAQQPLTSTPALREALETVLGPRLAAAPDPRLNHLHLTFDQIRGWNCALCGARLHAIGLSAPTRPARSPDRTHRTLGVCTRLPVTTTASLPGLGASVLGRW